MASKPHGLLLLFEGLPATVIQSQVFGLVEWLAGRGIATLDVMAVAWNGRLFASSRQRASALAAAMPGHVILRRGMRPAMPLSLAFHRALLRRQLSERSYDFIHARTDYAAAVAGPVCRDLGLPLIWDCRGSASDEFTLRMAESSLPGPLTRFRARQLDRVSKRAAAACDAAIFVSEPLRQKWASELGSKPSWVIPCVGDPDRFFFSPDLRDETRRKLGLSDDDVAIVYSGSLAAYQGFDMTLELLRGLMIQDKRLRWLILTPETEAADMRLDDALKDRCIVRYVSHADMNAYLNAADYGLLVRPSSPVNVMAFPTKFAEFGLAGLPVIMSDAVPDCLAHAKAAGNFVPTNLRPHTLSPHDERRSTVAAYYRERLVRDAYLDAYKSLYLLQRGTRV